MIQSPRFECAWSLTKELERTCSSALQFSPHNQLDPALKNRENGKLPVHFSSIMQRLSALNIKMNNEFGLKTSNFRRVGAARCAVHHELLTLQSRTNLGDHERADYNESIYDCCRLTCILYSNAVLLGIPPQSGWAEVLLPQLLAIHEALSTVVPTDFSVAVQVWSLMLGAIASKGRSHRTDFIHRLRNVLSTYGLGRWDDVQSMLESIMWSSHVCGREANLVWEDTRLAEHRS